MFKRISILLSFILLFSATAYAATSFKDVKPGNWFYSYVMKASEMGIIDGYADGTFRPSEKVTRAQLAKIIVEYDERLINTIKENSAEEATIINSISKVAPLLVYIETNNALGSGFFVKPNVIMTNAHVVDEYSTVHVETSNGEALVGTVIARDHYKDIALIKVNKNFNYVQFSTKLSVGQNAIALGHPLGLTNTVTKGIVSKLNITNLNSSNVFQFDAPVNGGNSGGPVINSTGKVIGMTTAKIVENWEGTPTEGLSFAISAAELQNYLNKVVK